MDNPVVIAGSLSKEELEKSINELVDAVDDGLNRISEKFDTQLAAIEEMFKQAGTKIGTAFKDSFNAAFGGSFDQLAAAMEKMSKASPKGAGSANASGVTGGGSKNQNITYPQDSVGELRQQIKELQIKLNYEKRNTDELQKQVDLLQKAKAELKTQTTTRSLSSALAMPDISATQIAEKMKALRNVQVQNADEAKKLQNEYQKLSQKQKELLGNTNSLTNGNNALARSFGYIRNRLVYALTIGSVMNFVKQMYSVRAEYELLERSMGVLIDNFRRGSEIFNELNAMALKSPFTLVELGTAAKQLLAYNFAEDEVVDTTRRLADISAALGVPMERLVYNLGQIRAQTALTARDARDFANAGLAIVPMLAKMYTEQKKFGDEIVTTAQVYDMMKKKLVSYEDVMKVIYQVTDEGGKFFDFQAKQAETLKVQLANLTLAWNNMLNDIASSNQTSLNAPIGLVKKLFTNWRDVAAAIKSVITVLGVYKTMQFLQSDTLIRGLRLARIGWYQYTKEIKLASGAMATFNAITKSNVLLALAGVLASVASYFIFFKNKVDDASGEIERFGAGGDKVLRDVKNLYAILENTNKNSSNYAKVMGELNQILEEYGLKTVKESDDLKELNKSRERNIELLKQEALEREHLNNINSVNEKYQTGYDNERKRIEEYLSQKPLIGKGQFSDNASKYAFAISNIISTTVEENLNDVLNKSGDEYFKGVQRILEKVKASLLASNDILGLSDRDIHLLTMSAYGVTRDAVDNLKQLKEAQNGNAESLNRVYNENKRLIDQNTTFNEKVDQSRRKLESASNDTEKFYGKLNKIVKDYSGKNIIEFLVDVNAQVPEWMKKMGIEQVTKLASQFGALTENAVKQGKQFVTLKSGERVTTKYLAMRTAQYTQARKDLEKVVEEPVKTSTTKKDELGDALTKELQLINDIQKLYKEYTKAGIGMDEAKIAAAKEYQKTLQQTNNTLSKFGVQGLTGEELATMDLRQMRDYYQSIIDKVQNSPKAVEALEKAIRDLNVELTKEGQKTIIDSLNNELSKLKDEYELAVELDANPELGGVFADMMGLSKDELEKLPRDFEGVVRKLQSIVDEQLGMGAFDVRSNLNKKVFDEWVKQSSYAQDSDTVARLKAFTDYANKIRQDETKKQIDEWNKLLEKYAEYEYKRKKIMEDAEREIALAREKGNSDIENAANIRKQRELAKLDFEQFQQSPTWIAATGDLATLTNGAIGMLIDRLEEYKKSAKNLDPKQIKQINNALKQLHRQQRQNNPFAFIANAIDEAKDRVDDYQIQIDAAEKRLTELNKKKAEGIQLTEAEEREYANLSSSITQWREEMEKAGKVSATSIVKGLQDMLSQINQVTSSIGEMFAAFGDEHAQKEIQKWTSTLEKGLSFAAMGASIGGKSAGGWGAAIGGVVGLLVGGLTAFSDEISGNASITRQIERSEQAVKRLELAYINLERAVEKAYGTEKYYHTQVAQATKQAELAELRRQLRLEDSRNSKHRDEDKILDLKKQILELENDINDSLDNIVNDFLGISSVGDAVEDLVGNIIDALRSGEDAMDAFGDSIDDMIVNMIKKVYSSKVIGKWFEELWENIDQDIEERTQGYRDDLARVEDAQAEFLVMPDQSGIIKRALVLRSIAQKYGLESSSYNDVKNYLQEMLKTASDVTIGDIRKFVETAEDGTPFIQQQIDELDALLKEFGLDKDATTNKLSNLQQGIQGITENTAGALEAYMNGVSQQVYLHSTLLTEIRDAVVGFNMDVQLGVQSQILLELQNSYQVQMAIQGILQGWSSANGLAVRVEMV